MKRGRKAETPATKLARGTFKPNRDASRVEIIVPSALPVQPEWLTKAGQEIWLDDIGRIATTGAATELDSTMFATYCNLAGAATVAWRSGEVPPVTALAEMRRMQEMLGIAGAKSRIGVKDDKKTSNPFVTNGR